MMRNESCVELCKAEIPADDAEFVNYAIKENYLMNWMIDGLPAAQKTNTGMEHATIGFHLGQTVTKDHKPVQLLNNHYEIYISYHTKDNKKFRIVGAFVNPSSTEFDDCKRDDKDGGLELSSKMPSKFTYTYDVYWIPSEIEWASRWDHYLTSDNNKIHWFSVINSVIVAIFLSAIVFGILIRALRRDISRYNDIEIEDSQEEFGWKMIHGDVFRSPSNRMFFSVFVGNGAQMLGMAAVTIILAALGFLSPSNRGSLPTVMVVFYVLFGCIAGYISARVYKLCGGSAWRQNLVLTSALVPGSIFLLLLVLNFFWIAQDSSSAVPFGTLFSLFALWVFLSIPLSLIGAYIGFRTPKIQVPVRTLQIPRQIPDQPFYLQLIPAIALSGILPFACLLIELMYIMNGLWGNKIYYVFGFLMLVFVILLVTTSLISIIVCYFSLCAENYNWWWRSFFSGASCGFYVFIYGIIFYATKLEISDATSTILFFGWTALMSAGLGLMTGTMGFFSCFYFVKSIYGAIKID
ncbi:hypothetical protein HDV06_000274 [Boothiomyces sp. JEL0866]|nr:hypothetical protein HDV06_000274 [Boothiomyces sp. JEL0866]